MTKLLRKLRAIVNFTWVSDCPKCHKHFYGFHKFATHTIIEGIHYRIVCHRCADKGIKK